ncbi:B-cell receptor CD22-like isoform X9 [Pygocentrus nattereri]|uniref:B-cell receptor CD22-like isoform X9 n=1 Tax=Pygocentrus nattereri TaxID=42514 RepID=UPI0018913814|nr:B-cell receptor CD22-like isoform X9 [Pygocentrus nattereri]
MTITDLRESDAHTYSFRFYTDHPDGRYSGRPGVTLSVTDLKVTVSDTDGGVKKLTCSSTCTLPNNPTYIWYRNGQPVSDQNRNELELRDRTVDAGSYSCAVKGYEELGSPAVCVFDKGLQVKVEGPAVTASEGQTVTLTCSSTCTLPNNPTYIWYRNGQPVSECESASCPVAVVSEAVSYSCAVRGSRLHSPPVYSPKTTRAVILPSGQIMEGDSVTLTCSSDANPPVLSYSWFNQSSDVELGTGQSYSITSISSQHSGLYYCTAQNQLGQSRSGPSRLDVLYSPRPPSVSETEVNGSVTLVCVSDSNPASSYTWFRKTRGNITQVGEEASLTLAAGADGVFYCMAENPYGSSTSSEWTLTSAGLWKQFAVWGTIGVGSALVLSLITAAVCLQRKRGAEGGADVQAPKCGDDTYSALNPNARSSDYDTLTVVRPHPAMRRAPENEN